MLMRLEGGVIQGNQRKTESIKKKKKLWHQKSQKEQRAPSNSSSLKLEQMVVWLLVWLFVLVNRLFFSFFGNFFVTASVKKKDRQLLKTRPLLLSLIVLLI